MVRAEIVVFKIGDIAIYIDRAGAYDQCEELLRQLLKLEPKNPGHWHQLAAVYLHAADSPMQQNLDTLRRIEQNLAARGQPAEAGEPAP